MTDPASKTIALATGAVAYSWVADATEVTTFIASLIGIAAGTLAVWLYAERAMKLRRERIRGEDKKGK